MTAPMVRDLEQFPVDEPKPQGVMAVRLPFDIGDLGLDRRRRQLVGGAITPPSGEGAPRQRVSQLQLDWLPPGQCLARDEKREQ